MSDLVQQFYDDLAEDYHLIFPDWKQAVLRQADTLDSLIRTQKGAPPLTVLDCTCGIGTQAIGLAQKGYTVHATDLSAAAIERAQREAEDFGVTMTFGVANLLELETQVSGTYDVVLTCDNALAHFLTDDDLLLAARQMAARTAPDGLFLASIRDYDRLVQEKPLATMPRASDSAAGQRISFQTWDWWDNGRGYSVNHFTVKQAGVRWDTSCRTTQLRALQRNELSAALEQAGLADLHWHMPEESGYYQPIVTARKTRP